MKLFYLAVIFILGNTAYAQMNYVRNPSLEDHTFCPSGYDQINAANYWSAIDSPASGTSFCFPEYMNVCNLTGSPVAVPLGQYSWQYPRTGNGMAQLIVFYNDVIQPPPYNLRRDYLQGRLHKKLIAGKNYCVTFWVCYEEGSSYAIKEFSAYLDNGSIDTTKACDQPQIQYTPQVTNVGGVITDTMRWTKVEGSFVANGTEQFITIGNFKNRANTTYIYNPVDRTKYDSSAYGYYLIDDISVIESTTTADAGPDTHVGQGDSVFIGRPNEIGLECAWTTQGSSTIIGTGAGIWVKPSATTSYVVTQTLCGNITKDTVKVEVWKLGVTSINGQQQYSITPNPSDGNIQLHQEVVDADAVAVSIMNAVGVNVYSTSKVFTDNKLDLNLSKLVPGLYYVILHDTLGKTYTLRFVRN